MGGKAAARSGDTKAGRARLRDIIAERSFLYAPDGGFRLASGRSSKYFFNLKKTMLDPEGLDLIGDGMLALIRRDEAAFVGGLAMGAVPIVVAVVLKSRGTARPRRGFWVRKEAKDHGIRTRIDGELSSGDRAIVFEDVTTTGKSALDAVQEIRRLGASVDTVVTVVDRLEGAAGNLEKEGLALVSLFDRTDFSRE